MNGTADKDSKTRVPWCAWRPRRLGGEAVCRFALAAAALALVAPGAAGAAGLSLGVSPQSVETGEAATLTVSLPGGDAVGSPQIGLPPGCRITSGPNVSQQYSIAGGRSSVTMQYTYRVVFAKAGDYTLGPATIKTRRGVLRSNRAAVAVRAAGKLTGVAVEARIEPARVYVGQPVVATFVFGISRDIQGYELTVPFLKETQGLRAFDPENLEERWNEAASRRMRGLVGHSVLDVSDPRGRVVAKEETRRIDGVPHKAYVVRRVIVAQEPGTYEFGAARAGANVVLGKTRARSRVPRDPFSANPFEGFFGRTRLKTKTVFATSEPLRLEVLPPPQEGRPPGFEGAVGRFEIDAQVTPRETTLGGPPFELTFTVKGEGNIETVAAPRLPASAEFRLGLAEQEQSSRFEDGKLVGEKRFSLPLRPSSARLQEIPSATLVAFDPFSEKYVVLRTSPLPVTVSVPEDTGALETVALPREAKAERRTREVAREDIEDIETEVDASESHGAWLHSGGGIVLFGLLPACAYAALAVHAARWRRLRDDRTLARRARAERTARGRLEEIRAAGESLGTAEFAEGLSRALQGYLADKLGRPAGEIPPAEAESLLRENGAPGACAREISAMLEDAEAARFGGGDVDRDEWLGRAASCIESLEIESLEIESLEIKSLEIESLEIESLEEGKVK